MFSVPVLTLILSHVIYTHRRYDLLLISTFKGKLYGIDGFTGEIKWINERESLVSLYNSPDSATHIFPIIDKGVFVSYDTGNMSSSVLEESMKEMIWNSPKSFGNGVVRQGIKRDAIFALKLDSGIFVSIDGLNFKESPQNLRNYNFMCSTKNSPLFCSNGESGSDTKLLPDSDLMKLREENIIFLHERKLELRLFNATSLSNIWNYSYTQFPYTIDFHKLENEFYFYVFDEEVLYKIDLLEGACVWKLKLDSPPQYIHIVIGATIYRIMHRTVSKKVYEELFYQMQSKGRSITIILRLLRNFKQSLIEAPWLNDNKFYFTSLQLSEPNNSASLALYVDDKIEDESFLYGLQSFSSEGYVSLLSYPYVLLSPIAIAFAIFVARQTQRLPEVEFDILHENILQGNPEDSTLLYFCTVSGIQYLVKRCSLLKNNLFLNEVFYLRKLKGAKNIVQIMEEKTMIDYYYLYFDYYEMDYSIYLEKVNARTSLSSFVNIWKKLLNALNFLKSKSICHCNINPRSILLRNTDSENPFPVICNFEYAVEAPNNEIKIYTFNNEKLANFKWLFELFSKKEADKILLGEKMLSDSMLVGHLIYYSIYKGIEKTESEEINAQNEDPFATEFVEVVDLVRRLVNVNETNLFTSTEAIKHVLFWSMKKRARFLHDMSDHLENMIETDIYRNLQKNSISVVRGNWIMHLPPIIQSDLQCFRAYKGSSVKDLLRAIRNKRNHFSSSSTEFQLLFEYSPNLFLKTMLEYFPKLIIHLYNFAMVHGIMKEKKFQEY